MKYSIILPTYNEKENIAIVMWLIIDTMKKRDYEIIVVDDSNDSATDKVAARIKEEYPNTEIKIEKRKKKLGLGSAYKHAAGIVTGDFVVIMDTDLSHNPRAILDLIAEQERTNTDIVIGTRYAGDKSGVDGWPTGRKVISMVA
ncbi:MAG: dolichol-phosphate mannosyltransferase, partial [Amphiamblys sp. WSBS2006]